MKGRDSYENWEAFVHKAGFEPRQTEAQARCLARYAAELLAQIEIQLKRLELYDFKCGAGPLERCQDWIDLNKMVANHLKTTAQTIERIARECGVNPNDPTFRAKLTRAMLERGVFPAPKQGN